MKSNVSNHTSHWPRLSPWFACTCLWGVAEQDQVQRGKRVANVTLDILTEQDGGAQWTEESGFLGDRSY